MRKRAAKVYTSPKTLRLILGDQLNYEHSWYRHQDPSVTYILMETKSETGYVRHHIQKVCAFFIAMRRFAQWLKSQGHSVAYIQLDDPKNLHSFTGNISSFVTTHKIEHFEYQTPDEYRLDQELRRLTEQLPITSSTVDTEHFLVPRSFVGEFFKGKKAVTMEYFYREMRRRLNILLESDGTPCGGKWNYDFENRKKLPKDIIIPPPLECDHDASDIVALLQKERIETIGSIPENRIKWPLDRDEARAALAYFIDSLLPSFGLYQDSMDTRSRFLFHSRLSFALNVKLLHPLEVIEAAVAAFNRDSKRYTLPQIEGFVRQILGWREFMRGMYWTHMPEYATLNYFEHTRPLPSWFWTGDTQMNCLKHAISQSLDSAYAHHIQRLMITGNFALLAGTDPSEVDAWYLGVYIDAIEWVEITNTRGMSQYADGGLVATKPYTSTSNYINKMSNYCDSCRYNRMLRHGENACPFNSLYWDFYENHRSVLSKNPRNGMVYQQLAKMSAAERKAIADQANVYRNTINSL
jgi:deoxyribodipyrimidine photolyase-related protein